MAWIYLAASEESQKLWMATSDQLHIAKLIATPGACLSVDSLQAIYPLPQSGTTLKRSTDGAYPLSTLSTEDSPAKTLALPDAERAWAESAADYFQRSFASLARYDRVSFSWKMCQLFVHGEETLSPDLWPASGMTVDGICYPLQMWARTTDESDGGYWPTPDTISGGPSKTGARVRPNGTKAQIRLNTAVKHPHLWPTPRSSDGPKGARTYQGALAEFRRGKDISLPIAAQMWPTPTACAGQQPGEHGQGGQNLATVVGGTLSPMWVEWLMGYPSEWTVLEPWATQWYRPKRGKRLKGS